jgi:hypothetical protein
MEADRAPIPASKATKGPEQELCRFLAEGSQAAKRTRTNPAGLHTLSDWSLRPKGGTQVVGGSFTVSKK